MLVDLLEPVTMTAIDVRMPIDERARAVAQTLIDNPADGRTLAHWGRDVGASERTLARAFLADTGLSFGQWRGLLRLRAAMVALATGDTCRQGGPGGWIRVDERVRCRVPPGDRLDASGVLCPS